MNKKIFEKKKMNKNIFEKLRILHQPRSQG